MNTPCWLPCKWISKKIMTTGTLTPEWDRVFKKSRVSLAVYSTSAHMSCPNRWRGKISPHCIHHPIWNEMVWICTAATAVRGFIDPTHWSAVITHSQIKNYVHEEAGTQNRLLSDANCVFPVLSRPNISWLIARHETEHKKYRHIPTG